MPSVTQVSQTRCVPVASVIEWMAFADGSESVLMLAMAPSQPSPVVSVRVSVSLNCTGVHQEVGANDGLGVGAHVVVGLSDGRGEGRGVGNGVGSDVGRDVGAGVVGSGVGIFMQQPQVFGVDVSLRHMSVWKSCPPVAAHEAFDE